MVDKKKMDSIILAQRLKLSETSSKVSEMNRKTNEMIDEMDQLNAQMELLLSDNNSNILESIDIDNLEEEYQNLLSQEEIEKIESEVALKNENLKIEKWTYSDDEDEIYKNSVSYLKEKNINSYEDVSAILYSSDEIKSAQDKIDELNRKFEELNRVKCDKYDYLISGTVGVLTGLIDVFFVRAPGKGFIGRKVDEGTNEIVMKIAGIAGWDRKKAESRNSDTLRSAIGFLEKRFKVNYDQQYGLKNLSTKNHHLKSLAHSPSPIGLLFSLISQFTGESIFIINGNVEIVQSQPMLQGKNFVERVVLGFVNWFMHLVSDVAGSSGAKGRGSGIPIPFYELLLLLHPIKIKNCGVDKIATMVFEQGYDFRHGIAMSVPVVINELLVRFFWALRAHIEKERDLGEIFSDMKNSRELQRMLLTSYGCFCLVDLGDALLTGKPIADPVLKIIEICTNLNLIAWVRFGYLGYKEIYFVINKNSLRYKFIDEKLEEDFRRSFIFV